MYDAVITVLKSSETFERIAGVLVPSEDRTTLYKGRGDVQARSVEFSLDGRGGVKETGFGYANIYFPTYVDTSPFQIGHEVRVQTEDYWIQVGKILSINIVSKMVLIQYEKPSEPTQTTLVDESGTVIMTIDGTPVQVT